MHMKCVLFLLAQRLWIQVLVQVRHWATYPVLYLFNLIWLFTENVLVGCLGWCWICDPPVSVFWVARTTGIHHHTWHNVLFKCTGYCWGSQAPGSVHIDYLGWVRCLAVVGKFHQGDRGSMQPPCPVWNWPLLQIPAWEQQPIQDALYTHSGGPWMGIWERLVQSRGQVSTGFPRKVI